eukprot:scaffold7279_cov175-Amphora_coffeaeformis.AAC.1
MMIRSARLLLPIHRFDCLILFLGACSERRHPRPKRPLVSTSESIASSAVKTAIDSNAAVPRRPNIAKFRFGLRIKVLTYDTKGSVARQSFGGIFEGRSAKVLTCLDATDTIVTETIAEFVKDGIAKAGDPSVVVHGKDLLVSELPTYCAHPIRRKKRAIMVPSWRSPWAQLSSFTKWLQSKALG